MLNIAKQRLRPRIYETTARLKPLSAGVALRPCGTREIDEPGPVDEMNAIGASQFGGWRDHGG
jgi:hypothetical protein